MSVSTSQTYLDSSPSSVSSTKSLSSWEWMSSISPVRLGFIKSKASVCCLTPEPLEMFATLPTCLLMKN